MSNKQAPPSAIGVAPSSGPSPRTSTTSNRMLTSSIKSEVSTSSSQNLDEGAERELELRLKRGSGINDVSFDGMNSSIENTYSNMRALSTHASTESLSIARVAQAEKTLNTGGSSKMRSDRRTLGRDESHGSLRAFQKSSKSAHGISAANMLPHASLPSLPSWMAGGSLQSADPLAMANLHQLDIEDIKPHCCALYFTSTSRSNSCCCYPRRHLQVGSIVRYKLMASVNAAAGKDTEMGSQTVEVEIVYHHRNGTFDVIDDDGVERLGVPASSLQPRPVDELDLGEARSCCGAYRPGFRKPVGRIIPQRTKIKLRIGSFLFLLINIVIAVIDSMNRTASDQTWWVSASTSIPLSIATTCFALRYRRLCLKMWLRR